MTINDPEVVAELEALYPQYERALVTNDVEKLVEMFWDGPKVMRFGVTENLYGPEELEAFRKARPAANLARTVKRLDIASFGRDFASITLEFERSNRLEPRAWQAKPGLGSLPAGLAHCPGACLASSRLK